MATIVDADVVFQDDLCSAVQSLLFRSWDHVDNRLDCLHTYLGAIPLIR